MISAQTEFTFITNNWYFCSPFILVFNEPLVDTEQWSVDSVAN